MVDRIAEVVNKVIPQFKSDYYMTPLRLNRDLRFGQATALKVSSTSMHMVSSSSFNEMPLPPMDWHKEMISTRETSAADSCKPGNLPQKTKVERKDPGFNFLEKFMLN